MGLQVHCTQDLVDAHARRGIATTLYVYTLVPLVEGAPHFPLYALAHDNSNRTFSVQRVLAEWQRIWKVLAKQPCACSFPSYNARGKKYAMFCQALKIEAQSLTSHARQGFSLMS